MSKKILIGMALAFLLYSCSSNKEKEEVDNEKVTEIAEDNKDIAGSELSSPLY